MIAGLVRGLPARLLGHDAGGLRIGFSGDCKQSTRRLVHASHFGSRPLCGHTRFIWLSGFPLWPVEIKGVFMKRFGALCAFALAVIFWTGGCNDYGNTFQGNTGASLTSISPSIVNAGSKADLTITLFGGPFVAKTIAQWNGKNLVTTPVLDANSNVLY